MSEVEKLGEWHEKNDSQEKFELFLEQTFAAGTAVPKLAKHLIAVAVASLAGNAAVREVHAAEAEKCGATAAEIREARAVAATQAGGTQLFWIKEDYEELLGKSWRRDLIPQVDRRFWAFKRAVFADGAVSVRTKELIAIAASSQLRCRHCAVGYIQLALKHGASRAEIAETLAVQWAVACQSQYPLRPATNPPPESPRPESP